jgi:hypothetical protein
MNKEVKGIDEDVDQELLNEMECLQHHWPYWEFMKTREGPLNSLYICRKCNPKEEVRKENEITERVDNKR